MTLVKLRHSPGLYKSKELMLRRIGQKKSRQTYTKHYHTAPRTVYPCYPPTQNTKNSYEAHDSSNGQLSLFHFRVRGGACRHHCHQRHHQIDQKIPRNPAANSSTPRRDDAVVVILTTITQTRQSALFLSPGRLTRCYCYHHHRGRRYQDPRPEQRRQASATSG